MAAPRRPLWPTIAYPIAILGLVPIRAAAWLFVIVLAAVVVSRDFADGLGMIGCIVAGIGALAYIAWRYRQEPHIESVWRARKLRRRTPRRRTAHHSRGRVLVA